jgi:hypothetical protein
VREIVGIVADTHNTGLGQVPDPVMVVPVAQVPDPYAAMYNDAQPLIWVVRTQGAPNQVIAAVTEQLRLASGGVPVAHIRTMDEVMGRSTARASFNMLLLTIFGAVALVLSAISIYDLMAHFVEQRTEEIGIRIALGADRSVIHRPVIWQGMRLALVGVAMGLPQPSNSYTSLPASSSGSSPGIWRFLSPYRSSYPPWRCLPYGCLPGALRSSIQCRRCAKNSG